MQNIQPSINSAVSPTPGAMIRSGEGRRAFTIIEMLTVIGIVTILFAISLVGMKTLNRHSRNQATASNISQARAMLAEFEADTASVGGLTLLSGPTAYGQDVTSVSIAAPSGSMGLGATARQFNMTTMSGNPALVGTEMVMRKLKSIPNVKRMMDQVSADQYMTDDNGVQTDILLDGFKDPIIFVPGGGLTGVNRGGLAGSAADSSYGPIHAPDATLNTTTHQWQGHPFWASAGEDSFFTLSTSTTNLEGDDNIYSFTP